MFLFEDALIHFEVYTTACASICNKSPFKCVALFVFVFFLGGGNIHKTKSQICHRIKYHATH